MNDIISKKSRVIGLDTNFLVDLDMTASPLHDNVMKMFKEVNKSDTVFCITQNALLEYLHVVTDSRRFSVPLKMEVALQRINYIKQNPHFKIIQSTNDDFNLCIQWLTTYKLGRKRLTDTLMASTYFNNGITELWTGNAKDFEIFGCFEIKSTVS